MKITIFVAVMSLLAGSLITDFAISYHLKRDWHDILADINECQQELPRNQTCKIIAIPDEGELE